MSLNSFIQEKKGLSSAPSTSLNNFIAEKNGTVPIEQKEEKKSFLGKVSDFVISSEKAFAQTLGEAGAAISGTRKSVEETNESLIAAGDNYLKLAKKQTDPKKKAYYLGEARKIFAQSGKTFSEVLPSAEKTPLQIYAEGAGVGLDVALAGGGLSLLKKGLTKTVEIGAKKTAEVVLKKSASEIAKDVAKRTLKDSLIGGTYGLVNTAQQKDATAVDYLKGGALGAAAGAVLPPVLGGAAKAIGFGLKKFGGKVGQGLESLATKAEQVAEKKSENLGTRFYEKVDTKPTFTQKVAEVTATTIRGLQKLPGKIATEVLDKYTPIKTFTEKLKKYGLETPDLLDMVQSARYKAAGRAENKLDDYLALRKMYGDDWQAVKEYSHYLDDLDRLSNGNKIAGDRTVDQVVSDMQKLEGNIQPEKLAKIKDGQRELQKFLNDELMDAVDSGRLSPEQYKLIKEKHPNYIPHDVLDYLDEEQLTQGIGKSFNVSKSGIEKAKGSTREIDDIDNAVTRRLFRQNLLNEKNKTISAVIKSGKKMNEQLGESGGFIPLRTAENVEKRGQYYRELKDYREMINLALKEIRDNKNVNKIYAQRVNRLNEKLKQQEDEFFDELRLLSGENNDLDQLYQRTLTDREAVRAANEFSFTSEMEKGYQNFKELAKKRRWMLEVDDTGLKTRLAKQKPEFNVDDQLFQGVDEMTNDEMLGKFQKRFLQESKLPKEQKGFIKRYEVHTNRMNEATGKIMDTEVALKTMAEVQTGAEKNIGGLESFLDDIKGRKKEIFENLKLLKDIKAKRVDFTKEGFENISYFNNGVKEDWLIPEDIGRALKNLNGEEASKIMSWFNNTSLGKFVTMPANLLRKVATSVNPLFAIFRNPSRDMQTAIITAGDDYAKGLIKTIFGKHDEELYRLARESGALQGSIFREFSKPEQLLAEKAREKIGFAQKVLRPDKIIEGWGQKMEELTRMSVFTGALKNGKTAQEAAKIARNATVDFGKSGQTIQVLNKLIPFLNARIQGFSNLGSAIARDPTMAVRSLMWSAAYPQAVLTSFNSRYESYKNIPDYEKRKYWIVMVGESKGKDLQGNSITTPHYLKIPKGEAQQAVSNVVERVLTIGQEKYPDSTLAFTGKLIGDISPVTESSLLPTGFQQVVELKTNYSLFKDKPIEGQYTKVGNKWFETSKIEPRYRTSLNTSVAAKFIGNALNWSPTKIDYIIKTGVLGDIVRIFDLPIKLTDKKQTLFEKATELPVVSGILGSADYGQQQAKKAFEEKQEKEKNTKKVLNELK
jgi:hypothetical protein